MSEVFCNPPDRAPLIALLNDLVVMELTILQTYEAATAELSDGALHYRLREFEGDHERHLVDLRRSVAQLGGRPEQDCAGSLAIGLSPPTASLTSLVALWSHEDEMARSYEEAVERRMVLAAASIYRSLAAILDEEQQHWAWLALRVEGYHRRQHLH